MIDTTTGRPQGLIEGTRVHYGRGTEATRSALPCPVAEEHRNTSPGAGRHPSCTDYAVWTNSTHRIFHARPPFNGLRSASASDFFSQTRSFTSSSRVCCGPVVSPPIYPGEAMSYMQAILASADSCEDSTPSRPEPSLRRNPSTTRACEGSESITLPSARSEIQDPSTRAGKH